MRRFLFLCCGFLCFVALSFGVPFKVYASNINYMGYEIPAFPDVVKDYDYSRIRYYPSSNYYELLCSRGPRPYLVRDYVSGGTTYTFTVIYPSGSTIVTYKWFPDSSDGWVPHWGPTVYSSSYLPVVSTLDETEFRSRTVYINYNLCESDGKVFFIKTPLIHFTNMQSSISTFLYQIYLLKMKILPCSITLLAVSLVSLMFLPKLFKVFLRIY